jgi:hypothetical protein
MWRLSWITFMYVTQYHLLHRKGPFTSRTNKPFSSFLPLTFTVGFFGMNVSTFAENPPLKWWFIVSIPVLAVVLILWYAVKHNLATQRQNPMRRGVYEALYHELATAQPSLWSRSGPRDDVVPVGWWAGLKWQLITRWFGEDKVKLGKTVDGVEDFGVIGRVRRALVRRWLGELAVMPLPQQSSSSSSGKPGDSDERSSSRSSVRSEVQSFTIQPFDGKEKGAVAELARVATPVALADADPTAASRLQRGGRGDRVGSLSPQGRRGSATSSDGGGVMVEEKGGSGDERESRSSDGRGRKERTLNVPR